MNELLPQVLAWSWFSERHGYDFNGYFIRHPKGNIVIDPVAMPEPVLEHLVREGVARIVLTNRNHVRDSVKLRECTSARVSMHAADRGHAESQGGIVDDEVLAGDFIGPLQVVDAHGKSPGEIALYWQERAILFVGDACVGNPKGSCSLLAPHVIDDLEALKGSLRRIASELPFDTLLVADGAPLLEDGRAALRTLVETFR